MFGIGINQILILFLMWIVPIYLAFRFNTKYKLDHPDSKSYRWGYFLSLTNGISGVIVPILSILRGGFSAGSLIFELIFMTLALYFASALYKRFMWPWVILLLMLLGLVIYTLIAVSGVVVVIGGIFFAFNLFYVIGLNDELRPINEFKLKFWEL